MKISTRFIGVSLCFLSLIHFGFNVKKDNENDPKKNKTCFACSSNPTIGSPNSASITSTTATLSANITNDGGGTCSVSARGVNWSTTAGVPTALGGTDVPSGTGTGSFSPAVSGLPAGTKIYFVGYGTNSNGTAKTTEASFFTTSTKPSSAYTGTLSSATVSSSQIDLSSFAPASSITNAAGYIVLRHTASNPVTTNLNDGAAPNAASDFLAIISSTSATTYTDNTVTAGNQYRYTLIPFNWDGTNNGTYSYNTTAGFTITTAFTLSTTPSSNYTGSITATGTSTTQIDLSFSSVTAAGLTNADGYIVLRHLSGDPVTTNLTNGSLAGSADDFLAVISSTSQNTYSDATASAGSEYRYTLIPYNWNGTDAETRNYNVTAGFTIATGYTFSAQPSANYTGSLTATAVSSSQIDLSFDDVTTTGLTNTSGYIVLRRSGSAPTSAGLSGGTSPTAATYYLTTINALNISTYSDNSGSAATRYFYILVPFNWDGSHTQTYNYRGIGSVVDDDYTFSTEPVTPPASFTAFSNSSTSINLAFSAGSTIPASGYLILRRQDSSYPDATNINDGVSPGSLVMPTGTTLVTNISSSATTTFSNTSLTPSQDYKYAIIPYRWDGSNNGTYNYLTSPIKTDHDAPSGGAAITSPSTINVCPSAYGPLGTIKITEISKKDFTSSGTIILELDNPAFYFQPTQGTVVANPVGNNLTISSYTINSSRITINVTISGNDKVDEIQISALKIGYDGTPPASQSANITKTGGTATLSINGSTYATINSAASGALSAPSIVTTDRTYCVNEIISSTSVNIAGTNLKWYSDASLGTLLSSVVNNVVAPGEYSIKVDNSVGGLGMTTSSAQNFTFYVTQSPASCESAATAVNFIVAANPVADAGIDEPLCSTSALNIGGAPTLATPSSSATYTYAWTVTPDCVGCSSSISNSAAPNPSISVTNNSGVIVPYTYTVNITDGNNCSSSDSKIIDINPAITPQLTQPNSTTFSTNTAPQLLLASPPGGVFNGIGVIQTGPSTYKFSATIAYDNTKPVGVPQNFDLYYSVTSNGCTVTNNHIATITLSDQLFSTLSTQYCSNENPAFSNSSSFQLSADINAYNNIQNSVDNWNNYTRFYYAPYSGYATWSVFGSYALGQHVRYGNEIFISLVGLNAGFTPGASPGQWVLSSEGKVSFNGTVRNYYEGYYSGNQSGSTIQKKSSTYSVSGHTYNYYEMLTNTNYVDCPNCDYNYPAFYMEFITSSDIKNFIAWNSGNYYYPGDIVSSGGSFYKCILSYSNYPYYTINEDPASFSGVWQLVSTYDNGQYYSNSGIAGVFATGQFVTINKNPIASFTGLTSGIKIDTEFCNSSKTYNLTGNFSGGNYQIDLGSGFVAATTINGLSSNPNGAGVFNPATAFGTFGNQSVANVVKIKYTFDPNTKGSGGQACVGQQIQTINVNPLPAIALTGTAPNPDPTTLLCYNGSSITLTSTPSDANVSFNGYGILDNANGTSKLNPQSSFDVSVFQTGTPASTNQPIAVTATYKDPVNGCTNTSSPLTYTVKPLSPATFTYANRTIYCYEDVPQLLQGGQANSYYAITYAGASSPYTLNIGNSPGYQPDYTFDPKARFDDAVNNHGANANVAQHFDILYTADVSGCTNTFSIRFTVNPKILLDIPGVIDNQIFCSSSLGPASLTVSGNITGSGNFKVSSDGITFNTPGYVNNNVTGSAVIDLNQAYTLLPGTTGYKDLYLQYIQQTAGCTGSGNFVRKIKVSNPPTLSFNAPPIDNKVFCRDDAQVILSTTPNSNAGPNTISISGPGITDNANGTAVFDPNSAMSSLEAANNVTYTYATRPTAQILGRITDGNGCINTVTKPLIVNPIPPASVAPYATSLCYTGTNVALDGQQVNAFYKIIYKDVVRTALFGNLITPFPDMSFNPKAFYDTAAANGANTLNTLTFDIYYTSFDADKCLNNLPPVTVQVAPQIVPTIAGINDNEEFCSTSTVGNNPNSTNTRTLTLSPATGTLTISTNGGTYVPTPFSGGGIYQFSTNLAGGTFTFKYDYLSGNNCNNSATKTIYVFPSPVADFQVSPKCDNDIIPFSAVGTQNNNGTPTYIWTFDNDISNQITAQTTQHQFDVVSTTDFDIDLLVNYPAIGATNLVCSSELLRKQTVGQIPVVDFTTANVCEGDATQYTYSFNIPIANIQWDFGDGAANMTNFGAPNQPTQVTAGTTAGTNGIPLHTYDASGKYHVILTAKTPAINGACVDTEAKDIDILKYLKNITSASTYSMKSLNGEDGFWVKEDKNGNSTWEFNVFNKGNGAFTFNSTQKAWVTNASGPYLANDNSYMNSPCFDLTQLTRPVLSMIFKEDTQISDGAVLQYSTNGGVTWNNVGKILNGFSTGQNWYNLVGVSSGPGGQSSFGWSTLGMSNWLTAKHSLDGVDVNLRSKVRFRLAFASAGTFDAPTNQGFAFYDVKIEERSRTILVENITNAGATNASVNNVTFQSFKNALASNEIVKIQYHANFPGTDLISSQNIIDPNARAAFYGVTSPPKAFVDGYSKGNFLDAWPGDYFDIRSLDASPITIDFNPPLVPDPTLLSGRITITTSQELPADKYVVQICVIERTVGTTNEYVLRKMLPTASGTALPAMTGNSSQDFDYSWGIDERMIDDVTNLQLVAFVQELQGKKDILQSAIQPLTLSAANVVTETENALDKSIKIHPSPADHVLNISLPEAVKESTPVKMFDTFGKVVMESTFKIGEQSKAVDTKDFAAGVYIIHLETTKGTAFKKVMVIHK
jgi:hypothetical protein